jgi:hypothetical protein
VPTTLREIIIIENGPRSGADRIVRKFLGLLPIAYVYSEKPNKSHALNYVLNGMTEPTDFIIFFDDDIKVGLGTLLAYEKEIAAKSRGVFLGGRVWPEYEEPPPSWLHKYLPPSVTGWDLGDEKCRLNDPDALGANWGAFATDLRAVGGFDEKFGPGTAARGQESNMQQKLLRHGIAGYYIPGAVVWHFVPDRRCSEEWALVRTAQNATANGIKLRGSGLLLKLRKVSVFSTKAFVLYLLVAIGGCVLKPERLFHYRYRLARYIGLLHGATTHSSVSRRS